MNEQWLTIAIIMCVSTDVIMNYLVQHYVKILTNNHLKVVSLMDQSNELFRSLEKLVGTVNNNVIDSLQLMTQGQMEASKIMQNSIKGLLNVKLGSQATVVDNQLGIVTDGMENLKKIAQTLEKFKNPSGIMGL